MMRRDDTSVRCAKPVADLIYITDRLAGDSGGTCGRTTSGRVCAQKLNPFCKIARAIVAPRTRPKMEILKICKKTEGPLEVASGHQGKSDKR